MPTSRKRRHETADRYGVDEYAKHARRNGIELVFETAAGDLGIADLGRLSIELQAIDSKWKQPLPGTPFALTLTDRGMTDRAACKMAQISEETLRRHRRHPYDRAA